MLFILFGFGAILLVTQGVALIYAIHQSKKNSDIILDLAKNVGGVAEVMRQFLGRMEISAPPPRPQATVTEPESEEKPWEEQVDDWKRQAATYRAEQERKLELIKRIQEAARFRREQEALKNSIGARAVQAEQGPIEEPTSMDD